MAQKNPLKNAIWLLLSATAIILLSVFVVKPQLEQREKNKENAALLLPDLSRDKILELQITGPGGQLFLKRKAEPRNEWLVASSNDANHQNYNADTGPVDGLITTLLSAKKESTVTQSNLETLGLANPQYKIIVKAENLTKEIHLGQDTPVDYLVYAKWSDQNEAFLTSRSLRFGIDKKVADFRSKDVFHFKISEVSQIEIENSGAEGFIRQKLSFLKEANSQNWKTSGTPQAELDEAEVSSLLEKISTAKVVDFVSEDPKDASKYGFQRPFVQWNIAGQKWKLSGIQDKDKKEKKLKFYVKNETSNSIYEVAEDFAERFKKDLFHYRFKTVSDFDPASLQSFSFTNDKGSSLEFTREANSKWSLKGSGAYEKFVGEAKSELVDPAIAALSKLKVVQFLDQHSTWQTGLTNPSRVIEFKFKGNTPPLLLFFGRAFGQGKTAVRKEGMSSAGLVEADLEKLLPSKVELYMPTPTPSANSTPATTGADTATKKGPKVKLAPTVNSVKEIQKLPAAIVKPGHKYYALMTMGNGKTIRIDFDAAKAPYTVSNFIHLARNGFYNGVKFHRVIKNFMAQGGDPTGTGGGGPGFKFDNEDNDLKHVRGAISMAHAGRNTNGSQFFIVYAPQPHLDGVHTVFGNVTEGIENVDAIAQNDPQTGTMKTVEVFEEAL